MKIKPIFSYVGGKFKYIDFIKSILPKDYNNYLEPFLGSGSLLLNLSHNSSNSESKIPKKCIVSDVDEIITVFKVLKENPEEVKLKLKEYFENDSKLYFNKLRQNLNFENQIEFVAQYLYLRRRCIFSYGFIINNKFNGCYDSRKINSKNFINKIDKFYECIKDKDIDFHSDFSDVLSRAQENDVIILDPPYFSEKKSKDWYTTSFNKEKQDILIDYIEKLKNSAKIIVFNFKNKDFINKLKSFGFKEIQFQKPYSKFKYEECVLINY